jgi:hypothetical protein
MRRAWVLSLLLASSEPAPAADIVVDPSGGGDFASIDPAILAAAEGDTVIVKPGVYEAQHPIDFGGPRDLHDPGHVVKNLTLRSEGGPSVTVLKAAASSDREVLSFGTGEGPSSRIEGFTILGGREAGVVCEFSSSPTIVNCRISGGKNAGVWCDRSAPAITGCRIDHSSPAGMIVSEWASPVLTGCTIAENAGHGIDSSHSTLRIEHCTFQGNLGSGIFGWQTDLVVKDSILWGNLGKPIDPQVCSVQVSSSCLESAGEFPDAENSAEDPRFLAWGTRGEVHVDAAAGPGGDGTREHPLASLEEALEYGLALAATSPCIGTAQDGGNRGAGNGTCEAPGLGERTVHLAAGAYSIRLSTAVNFASIEGAGRDRTTVEGTVHGLRTGAFLSDVTVTGGLRGGVRTWGQEPTILDCTISGNLGPGISCRGATLIARCTITGNSNIGEYGYGGGVIASSGPIIEDCRIVGNHAEFDGGGIYIGGSSTGQAWISNCIIAGNRAGDEGGAACLDTGRAAFANCTISGNSQAEWCTGIHGYDDSEAGFTNCIFWGNERCLGCEGSCPVEIVLRYRSCLFGDSERHCCGESVESIVGQDPLFQVPGRFDFGRFRKVTIEGVEVSLPDFVLEEPDFALRPGSPAMDAGTLVDATETDIEGSPRPCGEAVDIGAFEAGCAGAERFLRGDADASGARDISDAVALLGFLFLGNGPPGCIDAADADDGGSVDISDAVFLLSFLFLGGEAPPPPFASCGGDPTIDTLDCAAFPGCP